MTQDTAQPIAMDRELETTRCRLRYPRLDDVARLLSAFSSPQFPNDLPLAQCTTTEQVTQWVEGCQTRWTLGQGYTWTVEETASEAIVGQVTLARLPDAGRWALAFWTHPDAWGQGYATEAALRAIRFAFEELEASRVWAAAATWNQASRRVLHKLGMTYLADNPQGYTIQGRSIPTVEFEITRADRQP